MNRNKVVALRRIMAFCVDWLIILAWAGLLFALVMIVSSGEPSRPLNPWVGQAIGFLSMTLPVVLYFAVSESSRHQATLGKRVLGLKVRFHRTTQVSFGVALVRNAVKFIPWEVGHLVANQMALSEGGEVPIWVYAAVAVSMSMPLWWIGSMIFSGLTPYDRLTSTEVVRET